MVKVFSVVGDNFHNVKAYCNHNKAENCVKEMLKADKKGKIAVGFIEDAIESKHLKDKQVQDLVQEAFKQINDNKKGKISEKALSKAKKLKKLYESKVQD